MSDSSAPRRIFDAFSSRSIFVRNVLLVSGGTLFAQALLLLASPLLTRLYSAEAFGLLSLFTALVAIGSVLATLRYEMAIPLPKLDTDAFGLIVVCLTSVVGISALVAIFLLVFADLWTNILGLSGKEYLLYLVPIGMLGMGGYNTFYYWGVRRQDFSTIARTRILQSIGSISVQVIAGFLVPLPAALMVGQIVGQSLGIGSLARGGGKQWILFSRQMVTRTPARMAAEYRRFPTFILPSALINVSSAQLPVLLLSRFFGSAVTGWYGLAFRVLQVPLSLVGQALGTVFFANSSAQHNEVVVTKQSLRVFRTLVTLSLGPMLLAAIVAPELFAVLFGNDWHTAGLYAQLLMPWFFIVLVTSPLSSIVLMFGHQRGELLFQISLLVIRVVSLLLGALIFTNAYAALTLYAVCSTAAWVAYLSWLMYISRNGAIAPLALILRELVLSVVLASPTLLAAFWITDGRLLLGIAAMNALVVGGRVFLGVKAQLPTSSVA